LNDLHNIWKRRSEVFKYHCRGARLAHSCALASVESKMDTMQQKTFCFREFIKTAGRRTFRLRLNIQPPMRKSIYLWNHQVEKIGCLCKGKSSGQPSVWEENVRRIQESVKHNPRKSTRRASRELGIPQPTVWRMLRRHFLFNWVHIF